jgi:hypothetical protein
MDMNSMSQARVLALIAKKASKAEVQQIKDVQDAQAHQLANVNAQTFQHIDTADFKQVVTDAYTNGDLS